jgi:hypothetical protein
MASTITFVAQDEQAERILDAFEQRTGLQAEEARDAARVYPLEGDDHRIEIIRTLDEIDAGWNEHLALESPA